MDLSENESGSNSEEEHNVDKVINNARVPDSEDEEATGESSQEDANVEAEPESEEDSEPEAETEVVKVTAKELKKVEPTNTKSVKKNMYKDIILECFHHYPNENVSLAKIKSYAHTVHDVSDTQEVFLKKAMKKLLQEEVIKNQKGVGLAGSFKLVPQKPVKVKKPLKRKIVEAGGKIAKINAEVYANAEPKEDLNPKKVKKAGPKSKTVNKENIEEKVGAKKKVGTKKEVVDKKSKQPIVKLKEAATKPKETTKKSKETTKKPKETITKPKQATKRAAPKKMLNEDDNSDEAPNEDVPKKIRKPGPKKIAVPKEKPEVATKKTTVARKVPSKTTVVAVRKSLDGGSRPKRKDNVAIRMI
ncbi:unnamed protein product [Diamesa hyperborea]